MGGAVVVCVDRVCLTRALAPNFTLRNGCVWDVVCLEDLASIHGSNIELRSIWMGVIDDIRGSLTFLGYCERLGGALYVTEDRLHL
jgi:hypothetical protein